MISCFRYPTRFENRFLSLITVSDTQKNLIKLRYLEVIRSYKNRCYYYDWVYHSGRFIVLLDSALVPAILSIQFNYNNIDIIFWITWVLSLTVVIINGMLLLFRIEKKYFLLHIIVSLLQAEGYQYAALTGRYSGSLLVDSTPTHANQYIFFIHAIERIAMRETDIEYFRLYDNNTNLDFENHIPVITPHAGTALYHPTPHHPITPVEIPPESSDII